MKKRILSYITKISFFLCLVSCNNNSDTKKDINTNNLGSEYIGERKKENKGVVVFIHGIGGDAKGTWTNKSTGAYFPDLVYQDTTFKGYDVFTYNYSSSLYKEDYDIGELTNDMLESFKDNSLTNYSDIIIIAHSMGGLVSRQFLLKYRDTFQSKIKMLCFYATPTNGAEIANVASVISRSTNIGIMKEANGKDYLSDQSRNWRAVPAFKQIKTLCAYETLPTYGKLIVPFTSAGALCDDEPIGISENHFDIVKPANNKAKSFIIFRNAFKEKIAGSSATSTNDINVKEKPLITCSGRSDSTVKFTITNRSKQRISLVNLYLEQILSPGSGVGDGYDCPPNCGDEDGVKTTPVYNLGKKIINLANKQTYLIDINTEDIEIPAESVHSFVFVFSPFTNDVNNKSQSKTKELANQIKWDKFNIVAVVNSSDFPNKIKLVTSVIN